MFTPSLATPGITLSTLLALGACTSNNLADSSRYGRSHTELASLNPSRIGYCILHHIFKLLESRTLLTLILYSSAPSFQVTILSSNGTDFTSSMPILHSHLPLSKLQQRSHISVPITKCPLGGMWTSNSWCQHNKSPQASETFCFGASRQAGRTSPQTHFISEGRCANDEICVGSEDIGGANPIQAYCVSTDNFVRIGRGPSASSLAASFNTAVYNNSGSHLTVEAVITSLNKQSSVFAASVVMQAQAYDTVWRTVAEGSIDCLRCSSLTLAPFPLTAQRVKIDVELSEGNPAGLLWLASF